MGQGTLPLKQGLYDPAYEHDACGVGFVANIKGKVFHKQVVGDKRILPELNLDGHTIFDKVCLIITENRDATSFLNFR